MRRPGDIGSEGGAGMGLLLEGVRSPPEQTWLMRQMWVTHTAIESELRLLRHSMEYTFRLCILGALQRVERGAGKRAGRRGGAWSSRGGEGRGGGDKGVGRNVIGCKKSEL